MLHINPEKVCLIVSRAREFDAQEAPPDAERGASTGDEDVRSVLLAYADDPTFDELVSFIEGLNEDERAELVALAWVGREDFTADDWEQAVQEASDRHSGSTAGYLLGIPLLPDFLESGLNQLGYSCEK